MGGIRGGYAGGDYLVGVWLVGDEESTWLCIDRVRAWVMSHA